MTLDYNQTFGKYTSLWNGCCTTPTFFATWDQTDPRFSDGRLKSQIGFNLGLLVGQQYSPAGVALTTKDGGRPLIFTPDFSIANSLEEQGVRVVKYAPDPTTVNPGGSDNDFQYYRLADIYLMRAEAKFRKGDAAGALTDINILRAKRNVPTLSVVTLDKILNERGYEFYWDNCRRNDLVRFGKYCDDRYQKTPETDYHRILLPIPQVALESNTQLTQNPGY